jgi:hypothetical protein
MTDLKNYLFRVYSKFHIVSLDNDQNLKESVQILNTYKLNDLIRLLVFGHIDGNGYYSKNDQAKLALLSLLSNQADGSTSPLAVNLISNTPDSRVFRVDLGYLLLGKKDIPEHKVSLDTFMWILIFYSSRHYKDIKQNLIEAIRNLLKYFGTKDGETILEHFPRVGADINKLEKLVSEKIDGNWVITPSIFSAVINSIGTELLDYIKKSGNEVLRENKIEVVSEVGGSGSKNNDLAGILNAMFEIFKAGYYPASISSVLPDTIFVTMDAGTAGNISGLADYLLSLTGREYFTKEAKISDSNEDKVVRVVLRGVYATTCILNESYERWSHIEKRLPGAWQLFKIIYNRLRNGEYDTGRYKFSAYRLPFPINDRNEDIEKASQVSWFTLFSSFIMGHILNLIGQRNAKHLYKVAAPVVRLSQENIYLAPAELYDLKNAVVRYTLEDETELRPTFLGNWLSYTADDYYTPISNNPTGGIGYNSRYSIIITQQDEKIPNEITLHASESNHEEWQEVVEGKPVFRRGSGIEELELFFYDDDGNQIDIAKVGITNNNEDGFIEIKELNVSQVIKDSSENE